MAVDSEPSMPFVLPPLLHGLADAAAENHLYLRGMIVSPIHGTNGNVEYLIGYRKA